MRVEKKESWVLKNWCFWTVVLKKTLESPLDCKEIQPVYPKGNQSWIFIGRTDTEAETPIPCPYDVKNRLIWKDPDAGKDWRQEKGTTEDEMFGWHHRLDGHEFEQAPEMVKDREAWHAAAHGVTRHDWVTELNWTELSPDISPWSLFLACSSLSSAPLILKTPLKISIFSVLATWLFPYILCLTV